MGCSSYLLHHEEFTYLEVWLGFNIGALRILREGLEGFEFEEYWGTARLSTCTASLFVMHFFLLHKD